MTSNMEVEPGKCQCGCGGETSLAAQNNPARGIVKGQPMKYLAGHFQRTKGAEPIEEAYIRKDHEDSAEDTKYLEGKGGEEEKGATPIEPAYIGEDEMGALGESGPYDETAPSWHRERLKAKAVVKDDRKPKLSAYSELVFSAKGTPTDPNDVTLIVNGEPLTIKRGERVIVPRRFRECADHATYPVYHQMPDQQRMVVARVMVYPYSCLREDVPEAEYLAQKAAGDKISREIYERTMEMV